MKPIFAFSFLLLLTVVTTFDRPDKNTYIMYRPYERKAYAKYSVIDFQRIQDSLNMDETIWLEVELCQIGGVERLTQTTKFPITHPELVTRLAWIKSNITEVDGIPLKNITELDLSSNRIKQFAIRSKVNVPNLKSLIVANNLLRYVPEITELLELESIDLTGNRIVHLGGMLASMPNLTAVNLSYNRIERLDKINFRRNKKIASLYVQNNVIVEILADTFEGNPLLERFDISFNKLKTIPVELFDRVPELKLLNLNNNLLTTLDSNQFIRLKNLLHLNVGGNLYDNLPDNIFAENRNLETLSIGNTRLRTIDSIVFDPFSRSLRRLYVTNNSRLNRLCSDMLEKLTDLVELDLSNNDIARVPTMSMSMNLYSLRLDGNPKICSCNNSRLSDWIVKHRREKIANDDRKRRTLLYSLDCDTKDMDEYKDVDCNVKYGTICDRDEKLLTTTKKGLRKTTEGTFAALLEEEQLQQQQQIEIVQDEIIGQHYAEVVTVGLDYRTIRRVRQRPLQSTMERRRRQYLTSHPSVERRTSTKYLLEANQQQQQQQQGMFGILKQEEEEEETREEQDAAGAEEYRELEEPEELEKGRGGKGEHSKIALLCTGISSFLYVTIRIIYFAWKAKQQTDNELDEQERLSHFGRNNVRFFRFTLLQHLLVLRAEVFAQALRIGERIKIEFIAIFRNYKMDMERDGFTPTYEFRRMYYMQVADAALLGLLTIQNAFCTYKKQAERIWTDIRSYEKLYSPDNVDDNEQPYVATLMSVIPELKEWYKSMLEMDELEHSLIDKHITNILNQIDRDSVYYQQLIANNGTDDTDYAITNVPDLEILIPLRDVTTTYKQFFGHVQNASP